jgi:hypothetical protein
MTETRSAFALESNVSQFFLFSIIPSDCPSVGPFGKTVNAVMLQPDAAMHPAVCFRLRSKSFYQAGNVEIGSDIVGTIPFFRVARVRVC